MALPKLNVLPKYDVVIPSLGQAVKFRPYLVKEEKILLLAAESKDSTQTLAAVADTVIACIHDKIDSKKLTTFDVEYLFLKIRSKSVGERAPIQISCSNKECNEPNEYVVNVDDITMDVPETSNSKIVLTDEVSIIMQWPMYNEMITDTSLLETTSRTEQSFGLVIKCMANIQTEDENFKVADTPRAEVMEFIESLTSDQYKLITDYIDLIPSLQHTAEFVCHKCGTNTTLKLQGIDDFF
jgi:hypothetical protein